METLINDDNCLVIVFRNWLNEEKSEFYYNIGKKYCTNRRKMNYNNIESERPRLTYGCCDNHIVGTNYPKSDFILESWVPELESLRDELVSFFYKELVYIIYNDSCVINGYVKWNDYIYPHMDNEALGKSKPVITISTGSTREFIFKWVKSKSNPQCNKPIKTFLNNGDLLLMYGDTNRKLTHEISKLPKNSIVEPRFSFSFRIISEITLKELE